jgi:hypothetical protein
MKKYLERLLTYFYERTYLSIEISKANKYRQTATRERTMFLDSIPSSRCKIESVCFSWDYTCKRKSCHEVSDENTSRRAL